MPEIEIIKNTLSQPSLEDLLTLEWLDTNGLGSYASSSLLNCHTRKYHGFLVAELNQPPGKFVLLSKIEDTLLLENKEYALTTHQYPGFIYQGGYPFFASFKNKIHPTFKYQCNAIELYKEILLLEGENTLLIKYHLECAKPLSNARIKIRPFIAYRDIHTLAKKNNYLNTGFSPCKNGISISPYQDMPTLYLQSQPFCNFSSESSWYKNFEYQEEQKRGFDFQEDLYTPGYSSILFDQNNDAFFSCSVIEQDDLSSRWKNELRSRNNFLQHNTDSSLQSILKKTSKQFLIKQTAHDESIIAGYHWYMEWGRDAMIALPGLTLYSGLENECLNVLRYFSSHEKEGLIPNYITPDKNNNSYNTVDASLWFAWAVQQYYLKTNNLTVIKHEFWHILKNIFTFYQHGTLYNIKQHEDGLIYAGDPYQNLTWMDAVVNHLPVTPRYGAAVEVNALWYNMLVFMHDIADELNDSISEQLSPLCKQVKSSFQTVFWNEELGYLYDVVNEYQRDAAIRPNQIFAVSLPFSPLTKAMATSVVNTVQQHLLTPYGLRSLSSSDKHYIGCYSGDAFTRDSAFHQGTVWPWLLGHFTTALLKVTSKNNVRNILQPCIAALTQHIMQEAGLGTISEIFDGDPPYRPNGCISQAWSVAEFMRLLHLLDET